MTAFCVLWYGPWVCFCIGILADMYLHRYVSALVYVLRMRACDLLQRVQASAYDGKICWVDHFQSRCNTACIDLRSQPMDVIDASQPFT